MKKILALLLATVLVIGLLAGCGQDTQTPQTTPSTDAAGEPVANASTAPSAPAGELVVGSTTELAGRFFTSF